MLKALIFDMDGVLIDSMPYHADAWKRAFREVDINITIQDILEIEGSNHEGVIRLMFEKAKEDPSSYDFERLAQKKREIFQSINRSRPFDGIIPCIRLLKKIYLLAVVSGSDRLEVYRILDRFFPATFDAVVTGEDVEKGKPDPEPYLRAVQLLGIRNDECVVIENAPMGVESAQNAGLFCIAIPTYVQPHLLKHADLLLRNHTELMEYLAGLIK